MSPGQWRSAPLDAEVERAKRVQQAEHAKLTRERAAERQQLDAMMGAWDATLDKVADRDIAAWRLKVDAKTPAPRSPAWPDRRTHRVFSATYSPRSSPRHIERPALRLPPSR